MPFRTTATSATVIASLISITACSSDAEGPFSPQLSEKRLEAGSTSQALTSSQTFIVVYKLQSVPLTAVLDIALAGGKLVSSFPSIGVVVAQSTNDRFAANLSLNWLVQGVAPTSAAAISLTPDSFSTWLPPPFLSPAPAPTAGSEPLSGYQWNMEQIHATEARAITQGKRSVVVGVLDSGIDDSHPDLAGQVDPNRSVTCVGGIPNDDAAEWRKDELGHGTAMAGIIGAKKNGRGVAGIAPGASLASIKVAEYVPEQDYWAVYPEAFVCGVYWAANRGVDLANASLFVDPWYYNCPTNPAQKTIMTAVQRAVTYASGRGTTVIAASSNEAEDLAHKTVDLITGEPVTNDCKLLPVETSGVIGVSAVGYGGGLAFYSNYGLGAIDLAAPGGDMFVPAPGNPSGQILSPIPKDSLLYNWAIGWEGRVAVGCTDGLPANDPNSDPSTCAETYALLQGTSIATPHVTGVAALALSKYGDMSTATLLNTLKAGATQQACPPSTSCEGTTAYNGYFGSGQVDALHTID